MQKIFKILGLAIFLLVVLVTMGMLASYSKPNARRRADAISRAVAEPEQTDRFRTQTTLALSAEDTRLAVCTSLLWSRIHY
jgi:hypothetical protein